MSFVKAHRGKLLLFATILVVAALPRHTALSGVSTTLPAEAPVAGTGIPDDAPEMIARQIAIAGIMKKIEAEGHVSCVELADRAVCLHPDTPPEQVEEILRLLPTYRPGASKFERDERWTITATEGAAVGSVGDPLTLLWSIVPDGTTIDGPAGSVSNLIANFNAKFGSTTVWRDRIKDALEFQWGKAIGITYIEVTDDGADHPGFPGVVGVRGDVRIGGRAITDLPPGVIAYNFYPSGGGDMVLDTGESASFWTGGGSPGQHRNLRNTVSHEHGHGQGLAHVTPTNATKLMEPFLSAAYLGPQDDDIRGGQKNYGDCYENNDDAASATPFDTLVFTGNTDAIRFLSLDRPADDDWYRFDWEQGDTITLSIDPIGSVYNVGPDGGTAVRVVTDSVFNLSFEIYQSDGTTLLASANSAPIQQTETLTDFVLPAPTPDPFFLLRVYKAGGPTGIQRYDMLIEVDTASVVVATGACCFNDGSCADNQSDTDCATAGGTFQGLGTTCAAANCPILIGACCFDDGTCAPLTDPDCVTADGTFQGTGVSCESANCPIITDVPLAGDAAITDLALTLQPVPARDRTTASFRVPAAGPVTLEVFDTAGRLVRRIDEHASGAGAFSIDWDGADGRGAVAGSGVYFLRVSSGALTSTERTVLMR